MYLIKILHQTTTSTYLIYSYYLLYLIEILHQTTTAAHPGFTSKVLYLIEILHQTTTEDWGSIKKHWLYLIEILHQTTTAAAVFKIAKGCILSKFYIKPQLRLERELARCSCILSKFYIKPQRTARPYQNQRSCILSKFYIKPQQRIRHKIGHSVVSYRNSTSNHNAGPEGYEEMKVVSYRNSTSNHNWELIIWKNRLLYLIEILHQTTTRFCILFPVYRCILSKFYIKPQLARVASYSAIRCILSKFYIKPQLLRV